MKILSRLLLISIILVSILVGIFPQLANSNIYYALYIITLIITIFYLVLKMKRGDYRYNLFIIFIAITILLGINYRIEKRTFYALGFFCILFSYYSFSVSEVDIKLLNKICLLVSFSIIPTIILNGMFNSEIIGGTSFSGRLNPFMYFPYLLIAIMNNKNNKYISIILKIEFVLVFIDILWSESRISLLSMIFIVAMCKLYNVNSNFILDKKKKKKLKILLIIFLILQIAIPHIYIELYRNYEEELNLFTYKWTGKDFFSGRQGVWNRLYETLEGNEEWGTGDIGYELQIQSPHNEFLNTYYCWGIIVSFLIYIYLYTIGEKCIKNAKTATDLIIILSFISTIICTTFETYIYAIHFFVFNNLIVSYLLNKNENIEGERKNGRISKCNYTNL